MFYILLGCGGNRIIIRWHSVRASRVMRNVDYSLYCWITDLLRTTNICKFVWRKLARDNWIWLCHNCVLTSLPDYPRLKYYFIHGWWTLLSIICLEINEVKLVSIQFLYWIPSSRAQFQNFILTKLFLFFSTKLRKEVQSVRPLSAIGPHAYNSVRRSTRLAEVRRDHIHPMRLKVTSNRTTSLSRRTKYICNSFERV